MTSTKPQALPVRPENIPQAMRVFDNWCLWRYEDLDKPKPDKVPYRPLVFHNPPHNRHASSTNPRSWGSFKQAVAHYQAGGWNGLMFDGLMFACSQRARIVFVDLDNCRSPETGDVLQWAKDVVSKMNSYVEVSPSGKGLHIFVKGELPPNKPRCKTGNFEMYWHSRFATVTGHRWEAL